MRTFHWFVSGMVLVTLGALERSAFAQAQSSTAHPATAHPAAAHPAAAHPAAAHPAAAHPAAAHPAAAHPAAAHPARTASASPSPAPSGSPAPSCAEGEAMNHGHCCAIGADWAMPQRRCLAHNRRQALIQVVASSTRGRVPNDLAVTLDGAPITGTPASTTTTPGTHHLQLSGTGVRPAQQDVTVTAGQVQRVAVDLEPSVGRVQINVATANATVLMDDQAIAGTPAMRDMVPPGPHHVSVTAEGHRPVERDITVAAGETATVDIGELPALPPPPPPTPAVVVPPPPPRQVLIVDVTHDGQHFDIEAVAHGTTYRCEHPATHDVPCTLHDVPAGPVHITASGTYNVSDDVRMPIGTASVEINFEPSAATQGAYVALGAVSLVPAIVSLVFAATCHGGQTCDALPGITIGLFAVPGILPGAFLWASGLRPQGTAHITLHAPGAPATHARRPTHIEMARPAAPYAPSYGPVLFVF